MSSALVIPARGLVVAPRLPDFPKAHTGNPFTSHGDAVGDCGVSGCGWHAMGSRADVRKAWQAHYNEHHAGALEVGVLLLNNPHQ